MKKQPNHTPAYKTRYIEKTGDVWRYGFWHERVKTEEGMALSMEEAMLANQMSTTFLPDRRTPWLK